MVEINSFLNFVLQEESLKAVTIKLKQIKWSRSTLVRVRRDFTYAKLVAILKNTNPICVLTLNQNTTLQDTRAKLAVESSNYETPADNMKKHA